MGADQKHLLLSEGAGAVEKILVPCGLTERAIERRGELVFLRQSAEEARIDDRVHDLGKLGETVGKARRGSENDRDQRNQVGILPQQRKQPAAAVQRREKPVERDDRRVRIRRACKFLEQGRHDLRELAARKGTPE